MSVDIDGETMTMQKAAQFLKSTDRAKREEVFIKVNKRRMQDRDALDSLYDELIALRQKIARNAGFEIIEITNLQRWDVLIIRLQIVMIFMLLLHKKLHLSSIKLI